MEKSVNNLPFLTLTCFCVHMCACLFMHEKAFCTTCCRASCLFEESNGNSRARVSTYATITLSVCVWFATATGVTVVRHAKPSLVVVATAVVLSLIRPLSGSTRMVIRSVISLVFNLVKARKAALTSSQSRTVPDEMLWTDKGQEVAECL